MSLVEEKIKGEKYITNAEGKVEFVIIPIDEYKDLIELLEDHGMGKAIEDAECEKVYNKKSALSFLDND